MKRRNFLVRVLGIIGAGAVGTKALASTLPERGGKVVGRHDISIDKTRQSVGLDRYYAERGIRDADAEISEIKAMLNAMSDVDWRI